MEARITIIHGPNGVGKTVLLKMVENLFAGKYDELSAVPFESFQVSLDNNYVISVAADIGDDGSESAGRPLLIRLVSGGSEIGSFRYSMSPAALSELANAIERQVPWVTRLGSDTWLDDRTGQRSSTTQLVRQNPAYLPEAVRRRVLTEPEWLIKLQSQVRVYLIETQRLLRTSPQDSSRYSPRASMAHAATVKQYADKLTSTISQNLAEYGSQSQTLDQSFPERLINGNIIPLGIDALKSQLSRIEEKRKTFAAIGLIDEATQFNIGDLDRLEQSQRPTMTLYVADSAQKLSILDVLAQRIQLFLEIVNAKFRNKRILISRERGLVAESLFGQRFDLESLSSGEQHELVLTYDLLFNVGPNTFVMIDEPELSLHLYWQKAFLEDLLRIVRTTQMDVLLATHSPFIAGDRPDLMVALTTDIPVDVP
jgi:ABC-type lipoprotein export system ATPase subunit